MVRLGQLLDGPALRAVFERIVQIAVGRRVTRGRKMRRRRWVDGISLFSLAASLRLDGVLGPPSALFRALARRARLDRTPASTPLLPDAG
jgi:hypothetical protein